MSTSFVIDSTKKEILTELVNSGKNVLLTGATGCGKTTLAIEVAEELGLNPIVINMGSTQDARSSLLGYFTLKGGETIFQEADFLNAIQEPNTCIVLDELSRASDDAFNIVFPILDFRQEVRVDEKDESRVVPVADNVKFLATANIGVEYSSARSLDRALQDRFLSFNIPYLKGTQVKSYVRKMFNKEIAEQSQPLFKIYDYTHKMFEQAKLSTRISTRMVLDVIPLVGKFELKDILDHVVLSMFKQDSSAIINDANIVREYADSLGVYNKSDSE
jgi:MoxR-like ATPase